MTEFIEKGDQFPMLTRVRKTLVGIWGNDELLVKFVPLLAS
jgi:hypothetical protein